MNGSCFQIDSISKNFDSLISLPTPLPPLPIPVDVLLNSGEAFVNRAAVQSLKEIINSSKYIISQFKFCSKRSNEILYASICPSVFGHGVEFPELQI